MRRLILLRHAKSSWDDPDLRDHSRPLSERGIRAAPAMGRWLVSSGSVPTRVLCSDAVRTRQTWALVRDELGSGRPEASVLPELYLASPSAIRSLVREVSDEFSCVMVIGHNPGVHDVALALVDPERGGPGYRQLAEKFPTCATAVLDFDISSWREVARKGARLTAFVRPADLADDVPGAG